MTEVFKKGAKGSEIKLIQQVLNKVLKLDLDETGVFDDATFEAVKTFQKKYSLRPIDGIIDEDTGIQLNEVSGDKLKGVFPTAKEAEEAKQKDTGALKEPENAHTSRGSFVASAVKENSVATDIINKIYPYFPIAKALGASYVLKEHPHCHCEFKNGVKLPR